METKIKPTSQRVHATVPMWLSEELAAEAEERQLSVLKHCKEMVLAAPHVGKQDVITVLAESERAAITHRRTSPLSEPVARFIIYFTKSQIAQVDEMAATYNLSRSDFVKYQLGKLDIRSHLPTHNERTRFNRSAFLRGEPAAIIE